MVVKGFLIRSTEVCQHGQMSVLTECGFKLCRGRKFTFRASKDQDEFILALLPVRLAEEIKWTHLTNSPAGFPASTKTVNSSLFRKTCPLVFFFFVTRVLSKKFRWYKVFIILQNFLDIFGWHKVSVSPILVKACQNITGRKVSMYVFLWKIKISYFYRWCEILSIQQAPSNWEFML